MRSGGTELDEGYISIPSTMLRSIDSKSKSAAVAANPSMNTTGGHPFERKRICRPVFPRNGAPNRMPGIPRNASMRLRLPVCSILSRVM